MEGTNWRDEDWMDEVTLDSGTYERTGWKTAIRLKQDRMPTPVGLGLVLKRREL